MLRWLVLLSAAALSAALSDEDRRKADLLQDVPPQDVSSLFIVWCKEDLDCRKFGDHDATCNQDARRCACTNPNVEGPLCSEPAQIVDFTLDTYLTDGSCSLMTPGTQAYADYVNAFRPPPPMQGWWEISNITPLRVHCGSVVPITHMRGVTSQLINMESHVTAGLPPVIDSHNAVTGWTMGDYDLYLYAMVSPLQAPTPTPGQQPQPMPPGFELDETAVEVPHLKCTADAFHSVLSQRGKCLVVACNAGFERLLETDVNGAESHICVGLGDSAAGLKKSTGLEDWHWAAIILIAVAMCCCCCWILFILARRRRRKEEEEFEARDKSQSFTSGASIFPDEGSGAYAMDVDPHYTDSNSGPSSSLPYGGDNDQTAGASLPYGGDAEGIESAPTHTDSTYVPYGAEGTDPDATASGNNVMLLNL